MVRRVVTASDNKGIPTIHSDGEPPVSIRRQHIPGFVDTLVWATPAKPSLGPVVEDPTVAVARWIPGPGETLALVVTFPPDSVFADPSFDGAAARAEHLAATPGLAELFEEQAPGMHATPTLDYAAVLSGNLVLDLDEGGTTELRAGDVVVQNGVRHAWRNATEEAAVVFFVLIGAQR
jgi:hypothetical protein